MSGWEGGWGTQADVQDLKGKASLPSFYTHLACRLSGVFYIEKNSSIRILRDSGQAQTHKTGYLGGRVIAMGKGSSIEIFCHLKLSKHGSW